MECRSQARCIRTCFREVLPGSSLNYVGCVSFGVHADAIVTPGSGGLQLFTSIFPMRGGQGIKFTIGAS